MHNNYLVLIAGITTFFMAIFSLWKELTMRRGGVRTVGVIVDVERKIEQDEYGKSTLYRPLVQFVTNDGQQILWKCTDAASSWKNARGKSMRIIYDPRNPHCVIRDHWTGYAVTIILFLISALCVAVFFGVVPTPQAQRSTIFYTSLLSR